MIRVLLADDSSLARAVLRDLLVRDPQIQIVAEVGDGRAAVALTASLRPDLVIMDVMMPVMDGIEAVAEIMAGCPTPILMLSANTDPQDSRSAFAAVRYGALDVMAKPAVMTSGAVAKLADTLIAKVRLLSRIQVIRHSRPSAVAPARRVTTPTPTPTPARRRRILAIGASTGGPKVLMQLLKELPSGLPATVLVVQHITEGFSAGFADWLNREAPLPITLASDGDALQPGRVLVAPDGAHLVVAGGRIALQQSAPLNSCRPAVDALFLSLAAAGLGTETVGVILTGMGSDGAAGLAALHREGAYTFAQHQESCVVFGMPKAAIERGAVTQVAAANELPRLILPFFKA